MTKVIRLNKGKRNNLLKRINQKQKPKAKPRKQSQKKSNQSIVKKIKKKQTLKKQSGSGLNQFYSKEEPKSLVLEKGVKISDLLVCSLMCSCDLYDIMDDNNLKALEAAQEKFESDNPFQTEIINTEYYKTIQVKKSNEVEIKNGTSIVFFFQLDKPHKDEINLLTQKEKIPNYINSLIIIIKYSNTNGKLKAEINKIKLRNETNFDEGNKIIFNFENDDFGNSFS